MDNQFFTTYAETEVWLKSMGIKNYTINEDLTVDVNGDVDISRKKLEYIPVQFGIIKDNFNCSKNNLTTLKGSPNEVLGDFYCNDNKITSLKGNQNIVYGNFYCHDNPLIDFNNFEFNVRGNIIFTPIESMEYLDKYKNENGNIQINFNEFKKLQFLQKLNEKLGNDLSVKSVKIKHKI